MGHCLHLLHLVYSSLCGCAVRKRFGAAPPPGERNARVDNSLPTIVAADSNAKHPSCNSRTSNVYGNSLSRPVVDNPSVLLIGPNTPTNFRRSGGTPQRPLHIYRQIQVLSVSDLHDPLLITARRPHPDFLIFLISDSTVAFIMTKLHRRYRLSQRLYKRSFTGNFTSKLVVENLAMVLRMRY